MTPHLSNNVAPVAPPRSQPQAAAPAGQGRFADMLDAARGAAEAPSGEKTDTTSVAGDTQIEPPLGGEAAEEAGSLVAELVDALAALDVAQQNAQAPEPALLQKLDGLLDRLGNLLGVDLTALGAAGVPQTSAAPAGTGSVLDQLAAKIGDIAGKLGDQNLGMAQKLAALQTHLANGDVGADQLAKLGFTAELKAASKELEQSIQALLAARSQVKEHPPSGQQMADATLTVKPETIAAPKGPELQKPQLPTEVPAPSETEPKQTDLKQAATAESGSIRKTSEPAATATANGADGVAAGDAATGTDAVQSPSQQATQKSDAAPAARPLPTAYTGALQQVNLPGIAFEVARQVQAGVSKFEIRLDPPELGRIDVRLDMDAAGNVNAKLIVEKTETLDLLQRDQRALERALMQAGLDAGKTNLEFSLKQNSFARHDGDGHQGARGQAGEDGDGSSELAAAPSTTLYRGTASAGGVNIFV